jgi:hypothetical protein
MPIDYGRLAAEGRDGRRQGRPGIAPPSPRSARRWRGSRSIATCVAADAYRRRPARAAYALPDAVAMAIAIDPAGLITHASAHRVRVECASSLTRGQTIVEPAQRRRSATPS